MKYTILEFLDDDPIMDDDTVLKEFPNQKNKGANLPLTFRV